jgi:hypothetical protein
MTRQPFSSVNRRSEVFITDIVDEQKTPQFLKEVHETMPGSQVVPIVHCEVESMVKMSVRYGATSKRPVWSSWAGKSMKGILSSNLKTVLSADDIIHYIPLLLARFPVRQRPRQAESDKAVPRNVFQ